jgi:hypothetical protein
MAFATGWEFSDCFKNSRFLGVRKLACALAAIWCCDTKAAASCRTPNFHASSGEPLGIGDCLEIEILLKTQY